MASRYLYDQPGQRSQAEIQGWTAPPSSGSAPPPPPSGGSGGGAQGGKNWGYVRDAGGYGKNFSDMLAAGYTGLLFLGDDPNLARGMAEARNAGLEAGIWMPDRGMDPEKLAGYLSGLNQKYQPAMIVADVESTGKGYQGSAGWNYNERFAAAYQRMIPNTPWAVTMEPLQDDYNYKAYASRGAEIWPQTYTGDMSPIDPEAVVKRVEANGVPRSQIRPTIAPNQSYKGAAVYTVDDAYAHSGGKYAPVGTATSPRLPEAQAPLPPTVRRPEQTDPNPYPAAGTSPAQGAQQAQQYAAAQQAVANSIATSYQPVVPPASQAFSAATAVAERAKSVLDQYLSDKNYFSGLTSPIKEPSWSAWNRVGNAARSRMGGY
jgi:hypothetical protein